MNAQDGNDTDLTDNPREPRRGQSEIYKTQPFEPQGQAHPDATPRGAQLVTLEGLHIGLSHALTRTRTQIGRLNDNDLVLASNPVSKRHAAVLEENGLFFIEDLGSTNGVVINETRLPLDTRRRLYHGDNIRISDHLFMFRQESDFVDHVTGMCTIHLDHDKIAQEAQEIIGELLGRPDDTDREMPPVGSA